MRLYFTPDSKLITKTNENDKSRVFVDKTDGSYTIQLINIETQEAESVNFSIHENDFITEAEALNKFLSQTTSGI